MAIARLQGGPLDGQLLPLNSDSQDEIIAAYGEGQIVYRRDGAATNTGPSDGATEIPFRFVESTEPIDPSDD